VSIGSTVIGLTTTAGVSIGSSITIFSNILGTRGGTLLSTSRVEGIGNTDLGSYYSALLNTTVANNVSSGSTVIGVLSVGGISTGNYISINSVFDNVLIVGFSSVAVSPYNIGFNTTTTSVATSIGSTNIGVANTTGVSVGSSITIPGRFTNVPVVGFSTVVTGTTYNQVLQTTVNYPVSAGSSNIFVANLAGVSTGNYISAFIFPDAIIGNVSNGGSTYTNGTYEDVSLLSVPTSTYTVTVVSSQYNLNGSPKPALTLNYGATYRFDLSDASNSGHPLIFNSLPTGVGYTSKGTAGSSGAFVDLWLTNEARLSDTFTYESSVDGASYGNSITVGSATTGYYGNGGRATVTVSGNSVSSVLITNHGSKYRTNELIQFYSGDVGSTGSGAQYTVTGILTASSISPIELVSVAGTFAQISVGSTLAASLAIGSTITFAIQQNTISPSVLIGSAYTSSQTISVGSTVSFSDVFTTRPAVLISTGNTSSQTILSGTGVTFNSLVQPTSPAILISTGSTVGYAISAQSIVAISSVRDYEEGVLIAAASTINSSIPASTPVKVERFTASVSDATFTNLTVNSAATLSGITTIERAIISGLNYPLTDGFKGQVLATDGAGNIGFATGGGSGGSEVVLRVSSKTGSDNNDGKILPLASIKKATQLASKVGKPVTIFVETGEYVENNPIIVYDSVSIIGDSLRNIIVRPQNAGKDMFMVRNGCYITGMSFKDYVDARGVPQHTYDYSVVFDDPYNTLVDRTGYAATYTSLDITNVTYSPTAGFTTITTSSAHELARENSVKLSGIAFTCGYDEAGISTVSYANTTGVTTVTTFRHRGYSIGDKVFLHNLPFSCAAEHAGVTTTIFPDGTSEYGKVFTVTGVNTDAKTFTFLAGISTIPHIFDGWSELGISTFTYTNTTGIATATTSADHGFVVGDKVTLAGLAFTCPGGSGISTTIFPDGTSLTASTDGYTFTVTGITTNTFTFNAGISTIVHTYVSNGTTKKVGTVQKVLIYPEGNSSGQNEFGVVSAGSSTQFTIRAGTISTIPHYYTQGGTLRLSRPIINKSPYIQNCSILSSLGGNGILVDGDKIAVINKGILPELGEIPVVGDQPEFGKSMVAATFTMISFGGIGWRTINDGYAQVVSCFQIFCRYGSLSQSGGYLSITNSATNFGDKALRSTGFSRNSFIFDRGRVVANGTQGGLQTLRVVGLGRSDQELYVLRFINNANQDQTSNFKPLTQFAEFTSAGVNTTTEVITIAAHPFVQGDSVVYSGNEDANPKQVLGGLVDDALYYVQYIDASNFKLYEDDSLTKLVNLSGTFTGVGTLTKNNQEFFNFEIIESHSEYQKITLVGLGTTANFVSGRAVTQGSASGYAVTFSQTSKELIVSVEKIGGVRNYFSTSTTLDDHSPTPISVGVSTVVGVSTYWTLNFKVESTNAGNLITGINSLTENFKCHFHRPSIVNSSSHTWEYSGSGTDYNALPQNGGQPKANTEQVSELGGRVYASGTNELGDFKIGTQITAFNRTGNIIFNNKVTIGELASIKLSLSGGVSVEEFSTDTGLGDNETGGPKNSRVSTQLAVKSFLVNRLGTFIDKQVSTNAVPNAVVQLNAQGQINADLIPPQVVTFNLTNVGGGRTVLVNQIPAINIKQGDTIVEPDDSYVLVNDILGQYLIPDSSTADFTFQNGDIITSALTESVTGIVTTPPGGIGIGTAVQDYVGYGTTGLVKGVLLNLSVTAGGSGYNTPGIYTGVSLTTLTGIGTSAYGSVTVGAGNTVTFISAYAGGKGYAVGDIITASDALVGGRTGGAQFQATITSVETRIYLKLTNNQKFTGSTALPDFISDGNAISISTSLTNNYAVDIDPTDISTGGDIDFTNDRLVVGVGHQFGSGDPIIYDAQGGTMITASGNGILNLSTYYIKPVGVSSVELYYDYSLVNQLNFTGSGIGTHALRRNVVNVSADKMVVVGHGFTVGDPFRVFGDAPTGITTHEFYYIGAVTTNAFTLHETQADALLSVNGVTFNPVAIAATSSGITTFTNQNIRYRKHVNTSSSSLNNYSLLARDSIDASNIVSGIIVTSRLGTGTANDQTVLAGSSEYKKVVFGVGVGTTSVLGVSSYTSATLADGGVGVNTYYGNITLTISEVQSAPASDYSTKGVAKFKTTTFGIGSDGEVTIKAGAQGDVNANTFQGQGPSYYLNAENHTNSVPITRGGTGLTGVPGVGAILIGNGSAYNLTTDPVFTGKLGIKGSISAWNITTPGTTVGGIHLGGASGTSDAGPAITFGARDSSSGDTAMAGIYLNSGGGFGTRMYFATTDNYAVGSKNAMNIDETGKVSITRANLAVSNSATIATRLTVGSATLDTNYTLSVSGSFAATTKSFLIDHPTKEGMKLRYGSLEGPENGVYVRGRVNSSIIELPDYWTGLVDESTITVNLTPIGKESSLHSVVEVKDNKIEICSADGNIDCYYTVFGERKDVEKLEVEI